MLQEIKSWEDLVSIEKKLNTDSCEWIFRGQAYKELKTSLERAFEDYKIKNDDKKYIEKEMILDFKRACSHHTNSILPEKDDDIGWLALMRHYGAPSRLLDFSYSFFIASFFAVIENKDEVKIWAVNKTWLLKKIESEFDKNIDKGRNFKEEWVSRKNPIFRDTIMKNDSTSAIFPVNPMKLNERLAIQQGLFLCSNDIITPFDKILHNQDDYDKNVIEFSISRKDISIEILARLYRTGVNKTTLFPGLQGYAESLYGKIPIYNRLKMLHNIGARNIDNSLLFDKE